MDSLIFSFAHIKDLLSNSILFLY